MTDAETFSHRANRSRTLLVVAIASAAFAGAACSGASEPSTATNGAAPSVSRTVVLTEGTNMAAAASKDGRTLALTIQGRLWTVPVAGGDARALTDWDTEATYPSWSPDGSRIAFQNYSPDGFYHVWTVAADGSDPRQVTSGAFDHREPAWSPDGTRIAFVSDRAGNGSYDVWTVEVGSGALERRTSGEANENYPAWSPDGMRLAYSSGRTIAAVAADGQVRELATVADGDAGPAAWTPDGAGVVYLNHERQLVVGAAPATSGEDVFPFPASFLPDGGFVYTADGKPRIRDARGGNVRDVPFRAALAIDRPAPTPNKDHRLDAAEGRPVQGIFAPVLSPDGTRVAFVALNDLWVMRLGERPERLTNDISVEWVPSWAPDGREIFFSSDRDSPARPDMYAIDLASRAVRRVSVTPNSRMIFPALSPDGKHVVYVDGTNESLRIHDIASGTSRLLVNRAYASNLGKPAWSPDGRKVVVADIERANSQYREGRNLIRIVDVASGTASFVEPAPSPDGLSERFEAGPTWSPDGRWLAFVMTGTLHVMPVTPEGVPTGPARQVEARAADMPTWGSDGSILFLSSGTLRRVQPDGTGGRDIPVDLTWRPAVPEGTTVIHAGALWDGVQPALQRNVEITLNGGRIAAVRPIASGAAAAAKQSGARFVDATALTVMPGLWDAHVHPRAHDMTAQWWAVQLAYGITDVISNGASTYQSAMQKEALATGQLVGPRLFAGAIFDGPRPFYGHHRAVKDPTVLRIELDKARAMDMDFLKAYVRAPATFMRMISEVGAELGVVSGSHFLSPGIEAGLSGTTHLSATQRMGYGWSESEGGKSYQDVTALYAGTDFALVSHHSQGNNVLGDEPAIATDPRFTLLMPEQYVRGFRTQAATPPTAEQRVAMREDVAAPAAILRAGGLVTIGTDTPLGGPGLGVHARLRSFATGVTTHQALQAVTINAARYARADRELGTVEAGKIADLIFVRGDPLADVANAANVAIVMKNGIAHTAEEILRPFR